MIQKFLEFVHQDVVAEMFKHPLDDDVNQSQIQICDQGTLSNFTTTMVHDDEEEMLDQDESMLSKWFDWIFLALEVNDFILNFG